MIQRIIKLTRVNILNITRNKSVLFATIAFPLIFIGVFGLAFSANGSDTNNPLDLAIVHEENTFPIGAMVVDIEGDLVEENNKIVNDFISILSNLEYSDNQTKVFNIELFTFSDYDDALKSVQQGGHSALLHLRDDFTLGYMAAFRGIFSDNTDIRTFTQNFTSYPSSDYKTEISIRGDQTRQEFSISASVIESVIENFFSFGESEQLGVLTNLDTQLSTEEFSIFDYILPGLVIFGVLQNLATTANIAVRDVESGLLRRLRITKITGVEYTSSLILSQLIVALIQVPIFFGVATFFGFPLTSQIKFAFLVAVLMSLSVTGIGLIIASFANGTDSAGSISTLVSVPMAFLAGAFFVVPNPTIIPEGGIFGENALGLFDLLSATPAIQLLRLILIGGRSLNDVSFQIFLLIFLTIFYLFIGIMLYSKKHLSPEQ